MNDIDGKIKVEPKDEIVFNGPFDRVVTSRITLTNPGTDKYYFKVKTTVPKSYCVKPSCGYLDPGATVAVEVLLQPSSVNQSEKNKHKFMIQFLQVPKDESIDIDTLWKHPKTKSEDFKLKCVMKQPDEKIEIDPPSNIIFQGPFDKPVTSFIRIINSSNNPVCFQINCTNPKMFSVTPNFGIIEPHKVLHISVTLSSINFNPNDHQKERFQLEYVVTPDLTEYSSKVWDDFAQKKIAYQIKSIFKNNDSPFSSDSKYSDEISKLKSMVSEMQAKEDRIRRVTMNTNYVQSGNAANSNPGFIANNALLIIIFAFIVGILSGKLLI